MLHACRKSCHIAWTLKVPDRMQLEGVVRKLKCKICCLKELAVPEEKEEQPDSESEEQKSLELSQVGISEAPAPASEPDLAALQKENAALKAKLAAIEKALQGDE